MSGLLTQVWVSNKKGFSETTGPALYATGVFIVIFTDMAGDSDRDAEFNENMLQEACWADDELIYLKFSRLFIFFCVSRLCHLILERSDSGIFTF